jgi:hypothetical protein
MPVSSELFLAILAMDAYNRGYKAGIGPDNVGLGGIGSQIGSATGVTGSYGDMISIA